MYVYYDIFLELNFPVFAFKRTIKEVLIVMNLHTC